MPPSKIETSKHAKELSKVGAAKGGRARANVLTSEERSEMARAAVRARWAKAGKLKPELPGPDASSEERVPEPSPATEEMPFSLFPGELVLGPVKMECHVLSDLRRVFTQREIVKAISGGRDSGNLARYLERNPLIPSIDSLGPEIQFRLPGTQQVSIGREATTLIEICSKYLEARDRGLLKESQLKLALQADLIIRASAKVGIIALIDEATGYQKKREERALQLKLQAFIADDMQEWARRFPPEFWYELARLEGVAYSPRNRPLRWGKYIMAFVYDAMDKDVGGKLREVNPNPRHHKNHHQWLKEFGQDKLRDQILSVTTIMKLCRNMTEFREKFAVVFKKSPLQATFDDINWDASGL